MNQEFQTSMHHIRGSVILLSLRVFSVLFFVDTIYALILFFALNIGIGSDYYAYVVAALWLFHTIKFIFVLYYIFNSVLPWATTYYYVSDHHLIRYRGVAKLDEKIYELTKLREVDLKESWLGKILDYGTIHGVVSASGYNDEFTLFGVANAKKYERILRGYLAQAGEVK